MILPRFYYLRIPHQKVNNNSVLLPLKSFGPPAYMAMIGIFNFDWLVWFEQGFVQGKDEDDGSHISMTHSKLRAVWRIWSRFSILNICSLSLSHWLTCSVNKEPVHHHQVNYTELYVSLNPNQLDWKFLCVTSMYLSLSKSPIKNIETS